MKTIGILGGISWVSTQEYYRLLNQLVNEKLGGVNAARIILYSFNFQEIKTLTEAGDWPGLVILISEAAKKLEAAGADCLLIGANTMHKIADDIQRSVSIPVIHIATVTAEAIRRANISSAILLGTKYVMQQDFYKEKLNEAGITVIIPSQDDIDFINTAIYEEFGKNIFLAETKQRFIDIIESLASQGAGSVIFGCTEIPMLLTQKDCSIPVFDTGLIHAKAAIEFVL